MALRLVFVALWLGAGWSLAQACADVTEESIELLIPDFGTAYFTSLGTSLQGGEATLSDGVCIVGLEGWELRSDTLSVKGLGEVVSLEASSVSLSYFGWQVNADALMASEGSIAISRVDFVNDSVSGTATEALFNLQDNVLTLSDATAEGSGFRIRGEIARLSGDVLFFEDALATTCVCEGGGLYVIKSPSASYDLTQQAVIVNDGQLVVGGISISLPDLALTPETLANIAFPITIEYVTDDEATDTKGTGLGIRMPNLRVTDELRLELGLVGLDNDYPLVGVAVMHYKDDKLSFDVGRSPRGVQADFTVREPLLPWLDINFGVRNRGWEAAHFLHEGSLGLVARQSYAFAGHSFGFTETIFGAASSQTLSGALVATPRLGAYAVSSYRSPETAWGQFALNLKAEATDYPLVDKTQFGLRLQPSWVKSFDPVELSLRWDRLFTNGTSPFAKTLDKLEAKSELSVGVKAQDKLAANWSGSFSLGVRYDFLASVPEGRLGEKLEAFTVSSGLSWQNDGFSLRPFLNAELAPVFNPTLEDVDSYLEGGLNFEQGRVQAGFRLRYDPSLAELETLELSTSFPIDVKTVTLEPFLAFDLLPSLRNQELPRVSGQGLKLTWRSCCGTIIVAFRQVENIFSTNFAFQLSEP